MKVGDAGYVREKYWKGIRRECQGQRRDDGSGWACIGVTSDEMRKGED